MSVLPPTVCGLWYPAEAEALANEVDGLTESSEPASGTAPRMLVVPHAGLRYSGAVAGRTFARLRGRPAVRRVLLIGPSHRVAFAGCVVPSAAGYHTPLGTVAIDVEAANDLAGRAGFAQDDAPFAGEHSLEVQLPLLQRVLDDEWTVVPVLVGGVDGPADPGVLAAALGPLLDGPTCIVVSSDLTHFGSAFGYTPFRTDVPASIERLDREAIDRLVVSDVTGFEAFLSRSGATICGRNALRIALRAAPPGPAGRLVAYDTSARVSGDWSHVVSYAGLVFDAAAA